MIIRITIATPGEIKASNTGFICMITCVCVWLHVSVCVCLMYFFMYSLCMLAMVHIFQLIGFARLAHRAAGVPSPPSSSLRAFPPSSSLTPPLPPSLLLRARTCLLLAAQRADAVHDEERLRKWEGVRLSLCRTGRCSRGGEGGVREVRDLWVRVRCE